MPGQRAVRPLRRRSLQAQLLGAQAIAAWLCRAVYVHPGACPAPKYYGAILKGKRTSLARRVTRTSAAWTAAGCGAHAARRAQDFDTPDWYFGYQGNARHRHRACHRRNADRYEFPNGDYIFISIDINVGGTYLWCARAAMCPPFPCASACSRRSRAASEAACTDITLNLATPPGSTPSWAGRTITAGTGTTGRPASRSRSSSWSILTPPSSTTTAPAAAASARRR